MKLKYIIPIFVGAALVSCDDEKMEWGMPDGHEAITESDIPLATAEVLANYGNILDYSSQYWNNAIIGAGIGADKYLSDEEYRTLANNNFAMFTLGNAMKHSSVVTNSGGYNFSTIDAFYEVKPADKLVYGHNFLWHTQQRQAYLKSLIMPEYKSSIEGNLAIIKSWDFNDGTTQGWGSWGNNKSDAGIETDGGEDGTDCLFLVSKADANAWDAQCAYTLDSYLSTETEYTIRFKAKATVASTLQFQYQNSETYGSQGGYNTFNISTEWTEFEHSFTPAKDDVDRIILNFGAVGATYYIDDIKFGTKLDNTDPDIARVNVLSNGSFDEGIEGFAKWNGTDGCNTWNSEEGNKAIGCLQVVNDLENPSASDQWKVQIHANIDGTTFADGDSVFISFYIKTKEGTGSVRLSTTNDEHYQGDQTVTPAWSRVEWKFKTTIGSDGETTLTGINFDLGAVNATYLIDDVVVSKENFAGNKSLRANKAAAGYYVIKSDSEKRELLLTAMENWIKTMSEHVVNDLGQTPYAWDVVNECISDWQGKRRGLDGAFMDDDAEPTETPDDGLQLNWADGHFYWGYYIGEDYVAEAFKMARKYLPAETKLFINDYNLEQSDVKRQALIDYVKLSEETYGAQIDGIGTQMHITAAESEEALATLKEKVDAQFKDLAATGKLVRITELDVAFSKATTSPSATQLQWQAKTYQMVFESYKANVPEAQQSGITIWGISDAEDEHEYWLNGDSPNLWTASYQRKTAYKSVCDGVAGFDISTTFSGNDWKNAY